MRFKYRLKIFVDEPTARRASIIPEVVKKLRSTGTRLEYSSGVMILESKENHDIDEDLVKAVVKAIGRIVEAVAEIELEGRVKEVFRGKLDPNKPLGIVSDTQEEKPKEEEEEEEEAEDEEEYYEEDLFLDEEELEEEVYYNEDEEEY